MINAELKLPEHFHDHISLSSNSNNTFETATTDAPAEVWTLSRLETHIVDV